MFTLLAKLAEILSTYCTRFLEGRKTQGDTAVAAGLASCLLVLQDICVRGDQILRLADGFVDGPVDDQHATVFEELIAHQVCTMQALQELLQEKQALLATIDPRVYIELAPLLDNKSGLLTRWQQQASQSKFSTTTLFFIPRDDLQRVVRVGQSQASFEGRNADRADYLLVVANSLRDIRSGEVRDIRRVTMQNGDKLKSEIHSAHTELERAKTICTDMLASIKSTVGVEALAELRRKLVAGSH